MSLPFSTTSGSPCTMVPSSSLSPSGATRGRLLLLPAGLLATRFSNDRLDARGGDWVGLEFTEVFDFDETLGLLEALSALTGNGLINPLKVGGFTAVGFTSLRSEDERRSSGLLVKNSSCVEESLSGEGSRDLGSCFTSCLEGVGSRLDGKPGLRRREVWAGFGWTSDTFISELVSCDGLTGEVSTSNFGANKGTFVGESVAFVTSTFVLTQLSSVSGKAGKKWQNQSIHFDEPGQLPTGNHSRKMNNWYPGWLPPRQLDNRPGKLNTNITV